MKVNIDRDKSPFCFSNNSLDERCPKTTLTILRWTNTFGRVVYVKKLYRLNQK